MIVKFLILLCVIFPLHSTDDSDFLLLRGHAGKIYLGMTIDEFLHLYDRTCFEFTDLQLEGLFTPAIKLTYGGKKEPLLTAEYAFLDNKWVISRMFVYNGRFKTDKGISVGSTLGDLRRNYRVDWIDFGEGPGAYAYVEELGMSFGLDLSPLGTRAFNLVREKKVPDNVSITTILIVR